MKILSKGKYSHAHSRNSKEKEDYIILRFAHAKLPKEGGAIKIDQDKCVGCWSCIPYCPMHAINKNDVGGFPTAIIDQDECVECGVCLRSHACNMGAIYWPELAWPRAIRQAFSAVLIGYGIFDDIGIVGYKRTHSGGGRGTAEMKTNDVTGRYGDGEVGIAAELGRPGVGFYFRDLEKVAIAMAKLGIEFEPENPVTLLLDPETGKIKYREIIEEKALSAIIETKVKQEKAVEVLEVLKEVAKEINTVFSVDIINKCRDGTIPFKSILDEAGIKVRINGKTNVGLGRPLVE